MRSGKARATSTPALTSEDACSVDAGDLPDLLAPSARMRSRAAPRTCDSRAVMSAPDVARQPVALRQHGSEIGGECTLSLDHHVRKARMQRQAHHLLAHGRDLARGIDRLQPPQQILRLRERCRRRRIEPRQRGCICYSPGAEFQHQRRQIGDEDFGFVMRLQRPRLGFGPQAIADAGTEAAGAAAALVGRGQRHAHGFERRHAGGRIEARHCA